MRTQDFHFFGANVYEWKTANSLTELIEWFKGQKNVPYSLYYIPKPNGFAYEIKHYQPQAKGTKYLGTYRGMEFSNY